MLLMVVKPVRTDYCDQARYRVRLGKQGQTLL
jgi:hypothetical protein